MRTQGPRCLNRSNITPRQCHATERLQEDGHALMARHAGDQSVVSKQRTGDDAHAIAGLNAYRPRLGWPAGKPNIAVATLASLDTVDNHIRHLIRRCATRADQVADAGCIAAGDHCGLARTKQ